MAVVVGDPAAHGLVVQRMKLGANSKTPPHRHTYWEVVTVLSGTVGLGFGDKFEKTPEQVMEAGSLAVIPSNQNHYVWTGDGEAVLQTQFIGPANAKVVN